MVPVILLLVFLTVGSVHGVGMFKDATQEIPSGNIQKNYGVAVTNVGDGQGPMEWVVAGYSGPNTVLQLDEASGKYINIVQEGTPYEALIDKDGYAIGVCACDIDGDGLEEIYFLNVNSYSGPKTIEDRLFKWRNGRYEDILEDDVNKGVVSMFAGRSVACVDRTGSGKYGILLATYAESGRGKFGLIEMDSGNPANDQKSGHIALHDVAESVGIDFSTGGRGIAVGPILGDDGFSDIYFVNEGNSGLGNHRGDNALFKNDGQGHFTNVASKVGLDDRPPGRGVALADFNNDEKIDIVYGNWATPHRLQIQGTDSSGNPVFENVATKEFEKPSPIRTVIAADFDNSGILQVFMNNIVYGRYDASNKLYRIYPNGTSVSIVADEIGDAAEPDQYGTGAAVSDIDGDGVLELLVAHGESKAQGLSFFHVSEARSSGNGWLRILPITQYGAPARGAKVTLTLQDGTKLTRVTDGGSGYLCEMEPVAHFGLGKASPTNLKVTWPDGHFITKSLTSSDKNKMHKISFTGELTVVEASSGASRRASDNNLAYETRSLGSDNPSVKDSSNQGKSRNPVQPRRQYNPNPNVSRTYNSRYSYRRRTQVPVETTTATRRTYYYRQYNRGPTSSQGGNRYAQSGSSSGSRRRQNNYYENRNARYDELRPTRALPTTASPTTTTNKYRYSRRRYNYYGRNRSTYTPRRSSYVSRKKTYAYHRANPEQKSDAARYSDSSRQSYSAGNPTYRPEYVRYSSNPSSRRRSDRNYAPYGTSSGQNQDDRKVSSTGRKYYRHRGEYKPFVPQDRSPTSYRRRNQGQTQESQPQSQQYARKQYSRSQTRNTRYDYPRTRYQSTRTVTRSRYPQSQRTDSNSQTQTRNYRGRQQSYTTQQNNQRYPNYRDKYDTRMRSVQRNRDDKTYDEQVKRRSSTRQDALEDVDVRRYSRYYSSVQTS